MWGASLPKPISPLTPERRRLRPQAARRCVTGSRWSATASSTTPCIWSPPVRPDRMLGAAPTTARRSRRANPARRRYGASKGASPMPSSGASWRTRRQPRAAPLDKEEPRREIPRSSVNRGQEIAEGLRNAELGSGVGPLYPPLLTIRPAHHSSELAALQGVVAQGVVVDPHPGGPLPIGGFGVDAVSAVPSEDIVCHPDALGAYEHYAVPAPFVLL